MYPFAILIQTNKLKQSEGFGLVLCQDQNRIQGRRGTKQQELCKQEGEICTFLFDSTREQRKQGKESLFG